VTAVLCRCLIGVANNGGDPISLTSHLTELRRKHEQLSHQIEVEQRSPGSSDLTIATMKKQKLALKDEISRLSESLH
jgi:hypothetical protein